MAKVTIDNFQREMEKILKDYGNDVEQNLGEITAKVGRKGSQLLRNESLGKFPSSKKHKSRYGATWAVKIERRRLYTLATIYNKQPGFPHLLEFGHVISNGTGRTLGQVKGYPHIEPVERKLIMEFEKEVVNKL